MQSQAPGNLCPVPAVNGSGRYEANALDELDDVMGGVGHLPFPGIRLIIEARMDRACIRCQYHASSKRVPCRRCTPGTPVANASAERKIRIRPSAERGGEGVRRRLVRSPIWLTTSYQARPRNWNCPGTDIGTRFAPSSSQELRIHS